MVIGELSFCYYQQNLRVASGMIDPVSLYVCFPISDHAIVSPENSFYSRAPVYMHYLLKDEKKIPLRTSPS